MKNKIFKTNIEFYAYLVILLSIIYQLIFGSDIASLVIRLIVSEVIGVIIILDLIESVKKNEIMAVIVLRLVHFFAVFNFIFITMFSLSLYF